MGHPDYNLLAKLGQLPDVHKRKYEEALLEAEALKMHIAELIKENKELKEELKKRKK